MTATGRDIQSMLRRLEALLASGVLTQAEAVSCSGLAEALRRPARVAILGQSARDVTGVLSAMLGDGLVTVLPDGPAVEVSFGEVIQHSATFEDGSSLSQEGYPGENLMRHGPLFLQIEAPLEMLATMSFLALELGEAEDSFAPALRWAAKRSEIAILCAEGFGDVEAAVWAAAPDRLKNHCYLVTTGDRDPASARARGLFDAVVHAPAPSEASPPLSVLKRRLVTDISDARQEDVDAAALFLHRFREAEILPPQSAFDDSAAQGRTARGDLYDDLPPPATPHGVPHTAEAATFFDALGEASELHGTPEPEPAPEARPEPAPAKEQASVPEPEPEPERAPEPEPDHGADSMAEDADLDAETRAEASAQTRALVSSPILHLKRRSRGLAEILEWREEDEDWFEEVLTHCAETAEALRDLVAAWPDDDPMAEHLRDAVDQACDSVVLLQVEAGPDQAEDAARVLYQLRTDFEQAMAA
jgi:hypothetical protein